MLWDAQEVKTLALIKRLSKVREEKDCLEDIIAYKEKYPSNQAEKETEWKFVFIVNAQNQCQKGGQNFAQVSTLKRTRPQSGTQNGR